MVHAAVTFPKDVVTMLVCGWDAESVWVPLAYQLLPPGLCVRNPVTSQKALVEPIPLATVWRRAAASALPSAAAPIRLMAAWMPSCDEPGPTRFVSIDSLTRPVLIGKVYSAA